MKPPRSLRLAAAVVGVEAAGLLVVGVAELIPSLFGHPHDRLTAVLLGVVVVLAAVSVAATSRGLLRARRWAQTPTYLEQFFAIVIGVGQLHTLAALMVPLIVLAVVSLAAVSRPDSRAALGGI